MHKPNFKRYVRSICGIKMFDTEKWHKEDNPSGMVYNLKSLLAASECLIVMRCYREYDYVAKKSKSEWHAWVCDNRDIRKKVYFKNLIKDGILR